MFRGERLTHALQLVGRGLSWDVGQPEERHCSLTETLPRIGQSRLAAFRAHWATHVLVLTKFHCIMETLRFDSEWNSHFIVSGHLLSLGSISMPILLS